MSAVATDLQAEVIQLNDTWRTDGANTTLSNQSATGASVVQLANRNAYFYQSAAAGDFTAEAFNIGNTVTMTFTTTLNADAGANDNGDFRFMLWDETNLGAVSVKMDWGVPFPGPNSQVINVGVGNNAATNSIGTLDAIVGTTNVPSNAFILQGDSATVTLSATRTAANQFDVSFTWDDVTVSTNSISTLDGDDITSIGAIGIRLFGSTGNEYTVSNLSIGVIPEPATLGLIGVVGVGLIGIRRIFLI